MQEGVGKNVWKERWSVLARGYKEMAELNLYFSKEFFHLEEEGAKAFGLGTEKTRKVV
ncbi:hypothetical protein [Thermoactinomyces sp. DSM 45892]|uniref:hypothetical protein n=1 Tax=Thermoactinomyces sp. DSM 45892 TaxID=1882753 RepID=UPI000894B94A|nr:hypothetical protein [Thermoactinomyces sp. DSM 45892]SDX93740.1 hypothetical protein SAMN05444416_10153 [Thermoactinomyces sp. DSM 45892]